MTPSGAIQNANTSPCRSSLIEVAEGREVRCEFDPLTGVGAAGAAFAPAVLTALNVVLDLSFITKKKLTVFAPKTTRASAFKLLQHCQRLLRRNACNFH